MKTFLNAIKKYFADFGTAVAKGDIWCKLSLLVMGAGYWGRKQIVKGVLMTALEVVVICLQECSLSIILRFKYTWYRSV